MDINYILKREQVSLHNALIAASGPARRAHEGLASAYAALLADKNFPHRVARQVPRQLVEPATRQWEDDGGAIEAEEVS
ncbi:MAG: hypothetical protein ABIS14_07530 [Sphingomonas sp.]